MKNPEKGLPPARQGFTLMEILIVVAILMFLLMITLLNLRGQITHAQDSRRKTDLYSLRKGFEDYYNDHNTFPVQSIVNNCGSADMVPYLTQVPCDPVTKSHYGYFPTEDGGYRICAVLADTTDPAIASMGCDGPYGCGVGGGYNYCLTSGVMASAVGTVDQIFGGVTPTPSGGTPTPGVTPGVTPTPTTASPAWACAPPDMFGASYCKSYMNPTLSGCPKTYATWPCNNECQTHPEVRCNQ